jgi:DnaJ family protein C protein 9
MTHACGFRQVSTDEIARLAKEYQGSQEELADLKAAYTKYKGSMVKILDEMMFCTFQDEPRFATAIRRMIDTNEVKKFAAFANESEAARNKRVKRAQQEASEAEALASELGVGGTVPAGQDSMALIETKIKTKQQAQFDSMTSALEEKYCKPKGKQGARAAKSAPALPTDEEFERMRAEIDARKKKK